MAVAESSINSKRLYKLMLGVLKVIPMLLALCELGNTIIGFLDIDSLALSFIGGVSFLPLLFLYLASYVFRFCEYHRVFLHYILATNILNIYDLYIGIPVNSRELLVIHCMVVAVTLYFALYYHQKEKCCKR